MKKHIASVHEKNELFKYDICEKGMTKHTLSLHEKKKPEECRICEKGFSQKQKMRIHGTSFHKKKETTIKSRKLTYVTN